MSIVIIGTGLAGYRLAREVRRLDSATPLLLLTSDRGDYYPKPMLSNALADGKEPENLIIKSASAMAKSLPAEIRTHTRIQSLDVLKKTLATAQGELSYSSLVLATGAIPIRPPMAGDGADEVLSVNSLEDYERFRDRLEGAENIAIIGPGLIGCEFANDMISVGKQVRVIGPDPYPISTLLPEAAGRALEAALASQGIGWHLGMVASTVEKRGARYELELSDGSRISADLVVSAVGLKPDLTLAEPAGLKTNRGIVTNRMLAASHEDIYTLGDSAEINGFNLPFVMPLMIGAKALARTLTGNPTEVRYPAMPVVIKTPAHPIVAAPPPRGAAGEWQVKSTAKGVRALFKSNNGKLLGLALTGDAVEEQQALVKLLPDTLDA